MATTDPDRPISLAFVGHTTPDLADRAVAYEDAVLALLADHDSLPTGSLKLNGSPSRVVIGKENGGEAQLATAAGHLHRRHAAVKRC